MIYAANVGAGEWRGVGLTTSVRCSGQIGGRASDLGQGQAGPRGGTFIHLFVHLHEGPACKMGD